MKIYYIKYPKKSIIIIIAIIIIAIILLSLLVNRAITTFNVNDPIYKGDTNDKKIAFACNVAWGNEYIPKMLNIFKENNIKITFFFEGQWAEKNPDIVKKIATDGHEIASHGYTHVKYTQWSKDKYAEDIKKSGDILEKICGVKPKLFAPPYGDFNDDVVKTAEGLDYKVILWSLDTIDWSNPGINNIIDRVVKKAHNGAIVLMHPTKGTVEALPTMIKELKEKGYVITNISDILK
ncbi:polysaccharide deacetylase family protein [Thermoanaerobacterium sp. RBIITD]|uniref:polysaccharide deacetylase family protein n=1 Tax=Thermoanaerobacterium sp. RBIITD TaxID=1550240 RepID=UPI000BB854FB|nr:polysaccharide deacetylase family protein [Thermoanaerobacterium sp. RBIITD]SNX55467.1 polysaccharide deacetylase family sporulation protein PdaB [Thermoanaerobacterium sp. RBIITD]